MSVPSSPLSARLTDAGLQALFSSLSPHARLLTLDTLLGDDTLLVDRFHGNEALSTLFRFEIDCLAAAAPQELKSLIGMPATLRLLLADGSKRAFHGMVSAAQRTGSDGGLDFYRLTLSPWLYSLTLRRASRAFHDMSVTDIAETIFREYPDASHRLALKCALPSRSLTMQYRESDYDFLARLFAEEGLNFCFEHVDGKERLVIFDSNDALQACTQTVIRFHRVAATEASDAITDFTTGRQLQSNAVTLSSWNYKALSASAAEATAPTSSPHVPPLETYEGAGTYRYTDTDEATRIAHARAESLALAHYNIRAASAVRALAPGTWFTFVGHPSADGDYAVLGVVHEGANNFGRAEDRDAVAHGSYRNTFTCVPRSAALRPAYWLPKPIVSGAQVALVVGVPEEEITTERDHRIKVQFPWQRDQAASTWVRVAEPAAGANWGASFVPRIGQEVLIDFIAGDIDRPVVVGQLYNGADTPPFHSADNHAGALSGWRTRELSGGGFNQWTFDDTPGQLRQSATTSYASSQLNIGYLIGQSGNRRGAFRGIGFEAATDAWAALRAKRGLFVTTAARRSGQSTQLDNAEARHKLQAGANLAQQLSSIAEQHQAQASGAQQGIQALDEVLVASGSSDGQSATAWSQPAALLDSSAGISLVTSATSVLSAGKDLTLTGSSSLRLSGGQAVSIVAANTASLFAAEGGAKLIAAKEGVSLRAHTGALDAIADQAVTVTSSNGNVVMQAKGEILLASGGGYIRFKGGDIDIHCPASLSVKGVAHDFMGAGSEVAQLTSLPQAQVTITPDSSGKIVNHDEHVVYQDKLHGLRLESMPYHIMNTETNHIIKGLSAEDGMTERIKTSQAKALEYALRYKTISFKE